MSASNATEADLLDYIYKSIPAPWEGAANFYIRLHTADPGEAGTAVTNEVSYTSYDGVAVSRTTGFDRTGSVTSNAALVQFPKCTGGTATATHFSVCTTQNGAGQIIQSGALGAPLSISTNIQPQFNAGQLTTSCD